MDPLDCEMGQLWGGDKPDILMQLSQDSWRSTGDTVERLELLAQQLLDQRNAIIGPQTQAVMDHILDEISPRLGSCGPSEQEGLLTALSGQFVSPAPSGAPTRGRLDVLPTGRNFYSVDSRAVPTPTAWALGWKSANLLIDKALARSWRLATRTFTQLGAQQICVLVAMT